jgi:hypothetical protein
MLRQIGVTEAEHVWSASWQTNGLGGRKQCFRDSKYLDDGLCKMSNLATESQKIWLRNQTETGGFGLVCYLGKEVE